MCVLTIFIYGTRVCFCAPVAVNDCSITASLRGVFQALITSPNTAADEMNERCVSVCFSLCGSVCYVVSLSHF